MKTKVSLLLIILTLISSCTSEAEKNLRKFTLRGKIVDQDTGIIVLRYVPATVVIYDTAMIQDRRFVFKGRIKEPTNAGLYLGNDVVEIYIESGKMKITLQKDKLSEYKMTGSKTQSELEILNDMVKPVYIKLDSIKEQRNIISDSIKNSKNDSSRLRYEKKAEELDKQWVKVREDLNSTWLKFVLENPKSYVTASYLNMLEANEAISLDSLKTIFNELDKSIQDSKYGKYIKENIRKKENILPGKLAPDFKAIDINHETITLSQFKGKNVVLLEFWASWCTPCRKEIPYLKALYNKYNPKGFEVIAVTMDYNINAWLSAIKQDSIEMWYNIPATEKFSFAADLVTNDDIYKNYYVQAIPKRILIDKDGIIVGRWGGGLREDTEPFETKLEELLH